MHFIIIFKNAWFIKRTYICSFWNKLYIYLSVCVWKVEMNWTVMHCLIVYYHTIIDIFLIIIMENNNNNNGHEIINCIKTICIELVSLCRGPHVCILTLSLSLSLSE